MSAGFACGRGMEGAGVSAARATAPQASIPVAQRNASRRLSGICTMIDLRMSPQRPPLAILASEEFLRVRGVRDLHVLRIPLDALAGAVGDIAEVVGLGEQAAVGEVARRRGAGLAGVDPF